MKVLSYCGELLVTHRVWTYYVSAIFVMHLLQVPNILHSSHPPMSHCPLTISLPPKSSRDATVPIARPQWMWSLSTQRVQLSNIPRLESLTNRLSPTSSTLTWSHSIIQSPRFSTPSEMGMGALNQSSVLCFVTWMTTLFIAKSWRHHVSIISTVASFSYWSVCIFCR